MTISVSIKHAEVYEFLRTKFHQVVRLGRYNFDTWTVNFQMFKLVLEKAEEPEIKLPTSARSLKKQELQKNIYFCFIDYDKVFDCVDHNKLWKILKEMGIPYHQTCLLRKPVLQVKKQQLEMDLEQQTGSKLEKEYIKTVCCHSAYLTYTQNIPETITTLIGYTPIQNKKLTVWGKNMGRRPKQTFLQRRYTDSQ